MAKADPLAQLKDIHLPDPVGFWPLAPGWYGLIIFIILLLSGLLYFLYKKHRYARAKKKAVTLLKTYEEVSRCYAPSHWIISPSR